MHDAKGRPLTTGDRVLIPAIVKELTAGEDFCNVTVESALGRRPDQSKERISAINTGVMLRANTGDDNENPFNDPGTGNTLHPAIMGVLQFFAFAHLPVNLQAVSKPFHDLAWKVANGSGNAETTVALRKLLEAKDAAVRAYLFKP